MSAATHAWASFYFGCLLIGFGLAAMSVLLGSLDLHLPLDLPGHSGAHGGGGAHGGRFNFGTAAGFLMWLGGAGYALTRYSTLRPWLTLLLAALVGFGGAAIVFAFAARVLSGRERPLDRTDYRMDGVIATVTMPIRAGGTGEIVYAQAGVRRCAGARSADGEAIDRGTEVVVMHYERGIAYVRRWADLAPPAS